jgi:SAM-dependent methyltransferase
MAVEEAVGVLRTGRATSGRTQGANRFEPTWHHFEAARHRGIRRLLRLVPAELATTTFVDIGCGKGRALLVASGLPFHRLVGLEIDPSLVDIARTLNADHRVEVIVGDATAWEVEDDVGVVYLFNPFSQAGITAVVDQIIASLRRRPRPLVVLLLNPRDLVPFTNAAFAVVHADPQSAVLMGPPIDKFESLR